jgi:hypothetical protein
MCLDGMRLAYSVPALIVLAVLAGCTSQRKEELATVKGAHSVTAEWAAVEHLATRKKLMPVYAREMRAMAKDELRSDRRSLRDPAAPAARAIDAVRARPAPSAAALAAAARTLDQAGKSLEAR